MSIIGIQFLLLLGFGILFLLVGPFAKNTQAFFAAQSKQGKAPKLMMLTSSLVISWIFAKSITNAANLSAAFGIVGGVAYAVYYGSFIVGGWVIYQLRVKGGFGSLHQFLERKYGKLAIYIFSILIGFRLFNEVWSNTMVIGSYFGATGSMEYYLAISVFTLLTLAYTLKGGMSSSVLTDAIQMVFFGVLLFIILGMLIPQGEHNLNDYASSGTWSMASGLNLFFVALIQIFSYPFHDAVLTDRGFISDPKTTFRAFMWASVIGFCCIVLFSLVGIYAQLEGLEGEAPVVVGESLGVGLMLLMNFIMITSAASTLDSSFSSGAKLFTKDLPFFKKVTVNKGRLVMIAFVLLGTIPVFFNPEILSATTVSGTMVLGLAPVFILWRMEVHPVAFHLAVGIGIFIGLIFAFGWWPEQLTFFTGKYGDLLSANIIGTILSFLFYFVASIHYLKATKRHSPFDHI